MDAEQVKKVKKLNGKLQKPIDHLLGEMNWFNENIIELRDWCATIEDVYLMFNNVRTQQAMIQKAFDRLDSKCKNLKEVIEKMDEFRNAIDKLTSALKKVGE